MKLLCMILVVLTTQWALAGFGFGSNKKASPELVKEALANPQKYRFDDGGNISFGNGFYLRRFSFAGKPNACHAGNFLYAGVQKKCVSPVYQGDEIVGCKEYSNSQLKTQMVGSAKICSETAGDDGPCKTFSTVKFNKGPRVKVAIFKRSEMSDMNHLSGFKGFTYLLLPPC